MDAEREIRNAQQDWARSRGTPWTMTDCSDIDLETEDYVLRG